MAKSKQKFIIEEFKKYKVFLNSGSGASSYDYAIHLPLESGKAIFKFKSGRLKKNKCTKKGKATLYEMYCSSDKYLAYVDLLRNEKPLFFYHNLLDNTSYITTSDEPVGENE